MHQLDGLLQTGLSGHGQQSLVFDPVCFIPDTFVLSQVLCKFVCHVDAALPIDGIVNRIPQRGYFTVNAAEGALVHRGRVHLTHHSPDVGILGREVQDCGLIIIVTGVVEKAFAHLQFDWGAKAVKVRHYTPTPIDFLEVVAGLYITPAGEYAVKILLMLLAEHLQQRILKRTA